MAKTEVAEEGARSFGVFLAQCADGELEAACTEELHALVKKMRDTADSFDRSVKGSLTLKLSFAVNQRGEVSVAYDISKRDPKLPYEAATMFLTKGGNLSVDNPRQPKLPLREVGSNQPLRDVYDDAGTREI